MVKSLRSTKITSSKSVKNESWTKAEEFSFKVSPSPKRSKPKRGISVTPKSKAETDTTKRGQSVYLKKLNIDMNLALPNSPISRRTRRQSMANISKVKPVKMEMQRAKSEKTILKNKPSTISKKEPKKNELQRVKSEKIISKSKPSKVKLDSPKMARIKSSVKTSASKKESTTNTLVSDFSSMQIAKETFYKSPVRSHNTLIKRESMSEMTLTKLSPKDKPSKTPTKSPKSAGNPKTKATPLQKPLKRLSGATPSPRKLANRRLTRSAAKKTKKVQISAPSPTVNENFRKTPASHLDEETSPKLTKAPTKKYIRGLKPFTPKPEEPSKILKETLKKNIALEIKSSMKRNASRMLSPDIATLKTPNKSLNIKKTPVKNSSKTENSFNSSSFHLPATPLSSRKGSISFRQFRSSEESSTSSNGRYSHHSPSSLEDRLCSTPLKGKLGTPDSRLDDDRLINISGVSSTDDESDFTSSFTKSFANNTLSDTSEPMNVEVQSPSPSPQQTKRSYCSLM